MTFGLGVDLGTTFTAAAVSRGGRLEMATLGDRAAAIPSVLMIRDDGTALVGDAADRRAAADPARVGREVKRRLGDPTPLILGGEPYSAAQLLARLLSSVTGSVVEREGGQPDALVLTHPANWGPYKRELFESVPRLADLSSVSMISEPEAAAAHYASNARVAEGSVVAVYDLGGGTFDATVLRKLDHGFEFLGPPEGVEGLGGIDFDEAVFAHADRSLDGALSELDLDDPQAATSVVRLRKECVLAKEALSVDTETSVSVLLPSRHTEVRLTRAEFEEMIRPAIDATVSALRRALTAAKVAPEDLSNVLLVGGSSRIPLVSQMLSAELGRPTAVDTHPKHAVALGAALMAERRRSTGTMPPPPPMPRPPTPGRPPTPARGVPVASPSPGGPSASRARPTAPVGAASGPPTGLVPIVPASADAATSVTARQPSAGAGTTAPRRPSTGGFPAPPPGPPTGPPTGPRPSGPHPTGPRPPGPTASYPHPTGPFPGQTRPPEQARLPEQNLAASAAGTAPPPLGRSHEEAAEAKKRRSRLVVIGVAVAAVLAAGGVATAATLTSHASTPAPAATSPAPAAGPAPAAQNPAGPVAQTPAAGASGGGSSSRGGSGGGWTGGSGSGSGGGWTTHTTHTTTTSSAPSSSASKGTGSGS